MLKFLLFIALTISLIYARTVKFSVIAFGDKVEVKIGNTKYAMTKINKYDPVFQYSASLSSAVSYKYVVDGKEESFTRSLSASDTTTHNEFFERKDTVKKLPEFNHPDKGSWKRSIGKTSLFDDSYIPTVHLYGENANQTFVDGTSRYVSRVTFILKDDIIPVSQVACYPKNKSWPKFQFRLVMHSKTKDTSGVYGRYVIKFRDNNEDPTFFRQKLYSDIMDTIGAPTIQSIFARVYVNNIPVGSYVIQEEAGSESFARACFHGDNNGNLKITSIDELGHPLDCSTGADIAYGEGVKYSAFQPYNSTRYNNSRIKDLAKALYELNINDDNAVSKFDKEWFDITSFFKAVAMQYLTGHWDSYLFYSTNFAMYDDPTQSSNGKYKFYFICQDWDNTFGINLSQTYTRYSGEFLDISYKKYINITWGIDDYDAPRRYAFDKLLSNKNLQKKFENILTGIVKNIMNPSSFEPRLSAFVDRFADEVKFTYTTPQWRTGTEKIKWDMGDFERNLNYKGRYGVKYGLREYVCKRAKGINKEFGLGLNIDCSKYDSYKDCGPGYGYCHNNECCSKNGYCGTSSDHCDAGCQTGYGICKNPGTTTKSTTKATTTKATTTKATTTKATTTKATTTKATTTKATTTKSTTKEPTPTGKVSTDGRCGPNNNNTVCPNNQCCSKYGYCGTEDDHCVKYCVPGYGQCKGTNTTQKTTTKTTTTKATTTKSTTTKATTTKSTTTKATTTKSTTKEPTPTGKVSTDGRCGPNNNNTICPNNQCCSKYGYCGTEDDYCVKYCVPGYGQCKGTNTTQKTTTKTTTTKNSTPTGKVSTDGTCGPNHNNTVCPNNQCCSKYGYCGTDDDYCVKYCVPGYGQCKGSTTQKTTTKKSTTKTSTPTGKVSTDGSCGPEYNNTVCPNNQCCSKYGYCGTTNAYCGSGCQSQFGRCN